MYVYTELGNPQSGLRVSDSKIKYYILKYSQSDYIYFFVDYMITYHSFNSLKVPLNFLINESWKMSLPQYLQKY